MVTSAEPNVVATYKYSIAETATLLGIHRHTLRKYTEMNMIKCGFRRTSGTKAQKFYYGNEILRFWKSHL